MLSSDLRIGLSGGLFLQVFELKFCKYLSSPTHLLQFVLLGSMRHKFDRVLQSCFCNGKEDLLLHENFFQLFVVEKAKTFNGLYGDTFQKILLLI